jgi:ABC-2 type transport system permease protein
MGRYLKLYLWFWAQRLKVLLEYPGSTLIGLVCQTLTQIPGLLAVWVVIGQVPGLGGWNYDAVLLIYGLLTLSLGLSFIVGQNVWFLGQYVRTGGLDQLLVRPIDPLFQLVVEYFSWSGMGDALIGVVVTVQAMLALGILWSPLKVLALLLSVVSGTAIFMALFLIPSIAGFWIMDSAISLASVFYLVNQFAKYPLNIYPRAILLVLTWLLPYAFASYYPASYLLGNEAGRLVWAGPLVAVTLLFVGYRFWLFGLRRYASTGS